MNEGRLVEVVLGLPCVREFFDGLAEAALSGRHVVIPTGTAEPKGALFRKGLDLALFRRQGPSMRDVHLVDQTPPETPAQFLARVLDVPEAAFRPGAAPVEVPSVREVFWLQSPCKDMAQWVAFLIGLGRSTSGNDYVTAWALPGGSAISTLTAQTWLVVAPWWEQTSLLEWRLACRVANESELRSAAALWREGILPELAGPHVGVIEALWDAVLEPEVRLARAVAEHSASLGLRQSELRPLIESARGTPAAKTGGIPPVWVQLLERGAAQNTVEHGVELSAVAMAAMNDLESLRMRLWRGQASLLLPWLTEIRHELCRRLVERYGARWAGSLAANRLDENDRRKLDVNPLAAEFPTVVAAIRSSPFRSKLEPIAQAAWKLRNQIAHCEPVAFAEFKTLHDAVRAAALR